MKVTQEHLSKLGTLLTSIKKTLVSRKKQMDKRFLDAQQCQSENENGELWGRVATMFSELGDGLENLGVIVDNVAKMLTENEDNLIQQSGAPTHDVTLNLEGADYYVGLQDDGGEPCSVLTYDGEKHIMVPMDDGEAPEDKLGSIPSTLPVAQATVRSIRPTFPSSPVIIFKNDCVLVSTRRARKPAEETTESVPAE